MQIVFDTTQVKRYSFPTHINDLLIDRAQSNFSEVFMVIVEPGKSVHHHKHTDTEQIFYMLEGSGILSIGEEKKEFAVKPGNVVRIPVNTLHSIRTDSTNQLIRYLCVDCFGSKPKEASWDEHVKAVCKEKGYNYDEVAGKK
jgi:quercetin dioxygenase-like cupin family protein